MQDELGNYLLLQVRLGPEAASVGALSPSIPGCDLFGNKITAGVFREVKMRSEEALVPPDLVLIKGEVWMQTGRGGVHVKVMQRQGDTSTSHRTQGLPADPRSPGEGLGPYDTWTSDFLPQGLGETPPCHLSPSSGVPVETNTPTILTDGFHFIASSSASTMHDANSGCLDGHAVWTLKIVLSELPAFL